MELVCYRSSQVPVPLTVADSALQAPIVRIPLVMIQEEKQFLLSLLMI
jgi:hypothetical protein